MHSPTRQRPTCLVSVLVLTMLICIVPFKNVRSQTSTDQTRANDTFTLNLNNVDIHSLIETVSRHTGKNFVVDPRVSATVSVVSSEPVNADRLYELFLSVLDVHGFAAVSSGIITKIVPTQAGTQSAVPTVTAPTEKDQLISGNELITEIVKLEHVPAQQLLEILRPMIPAPASIAAEPNSNTMIITDRAANIVRLTEVIRKLDTTQ